MFNKFSRVMLILVVSACFIISGCGEDKKVEKTCSTEPSEKAVKAASATKDIELNFVEGQVDTYKSFTSSIKRIDYISPSKGEESKKKTEIIRSSVFDQKVESVTGGLAICKITLKEITVSSKQASGEDMVFDSTDPQCKDDSMMSMIGQSYTISISKNGEIKLVDNAEAKRAGKDHIAKSLVDETVILMRHKSIQLPASDAKTIPVEGSWKDVVAAPKGSFQPTKNEKIYTLNSVKEIDGKEIANIEISSIPSSEPVSGQNFLMKSFDSKDGYTGMVQMDLTNGKILKLKDVYLSTNVGIDDSMVTEGVDAVEPDVLTISYEFIVEVTKL